MAMELQLGLALPTVLVTSPMTTGIATKGLLLDLNSSSSYYGNDDQSDASIEGHGSSISIHETDHHSFHDDDIGSCSVRSVEKKKKKKKRRLGEAFEDDTASTDALPRFRTLPLLLWDKQPKEDDDQPDRLNTCSLTLIKNGDEMEGVVGWPPIKSNRKKHSTQAQPAAENGGPRGGGCGVGVGGGSNCLYVKVQMEGVLITRKIDLSLHHCYETLISALLFMFGRAHESAEGYILAYLDKEGDWLLAADVPWRILVESVQRLKVLRRDN